MRFAYIDSQGNEVPIPSVDALALRIELGAIGPDTQLYDAQTDRWGPASSHEIFHTLSRGTAEEGFVAPPPPVVSGEPAETEGSAYPGEPAEPAKPAETTDLPEPLELDGPVERTEPEELVGSDSVPRVPATEETSDAETGSGGGGERAQDHPVFDLSNEFFFESDVEENGSEEVKQAGGEGDVPADTTGPELSGEDLGLDLTLTDMGLATSGEVAAAPPEPEVPEPPPPEEPFDFGGFGVLELEDSPVEEDEETAPMEPAMPGEPGAAAVSSDESGDSMGFSAPGDLGGDLELERPMSEFTPESPPEWMQEEREEQREQDRSGGEGDADGAMEFGPGGAEPPEETERKSRAGTPSPPPRPPRPPRERPTPRSRPSPPRRVKRRSPVRMVGGIVVVLALVGGGWYGWRWYGGHAAGERAVAAAEQASPPVRIPRIPAGLLPKMRDLGNAALSATVTRLTGLQKAFHLPAKPPSDWLAGVYMANASKYGDVPAYWQGIQSYMDSVRAVDAQVFHQEYLRQLDRAGIKGDTARMLLDRADAGFAATRRERGAAYARMDHLVSASLNLHQFLLDNESQIDYDPAAGGVSRDPVLEAVPKTKALGTKMWNKVDQITGALDSLGALDKVTTQQLVAVLFNRIRKAGFK